MGFSPYTVLGLILHDRSEGQSYMWPNDVWSLGLRLIFHQLHNIAPKLIGKTKHVLVTSHYSTTNKEFNDVIILYLS